MLILIYSVLNGDSKQEDMCAYLGKDLQVFESFVSKIHAELEVSFDNADADKHNDQIIIRLQSEQKFMDFLKAFNRVKAMSDIFHYLSVIKN